MHAWDFYMLCKYRGAYLYLTLNLEIGKESNGQQSRPSMCLSQVRGVCIKQPHSPCQQRGSGHRLPPVRWLRSIDIRSLHV